MESISHHILVIGYVWPEPNSSAAGSRMMQLLQLFLSHGWKVIFASPAQETEHMVDLEAIGIKKQHILLNDKSFDIFISKLQPTMVMFDRFMMEEQFGWRVSEQCPNAMKILDTEDLHSLRKVRHESLKTGKVFDVNDFLRSDVAKREIASIYRCDLSLIISEAEMDLLTTNFKVHAPLLHYLPFMLKRIDQREQKSWPSFESRRHFVTIGNFRHEPNWNAVLYLKETIWPLIRERLPEAELHVYGAYLPPKASQLHNPKQGFHVKGWAEDPEEVMSKARICLAPLRFGAGLKGKLVEAMRCGTPSVTTNIGAEGINGDLPWAGAIEDEAKAFVEGCIQLYENKDSWQLAQEHGIAIINERFEASGKEKAFMDDIVSIYESLESHRLNNFAGMLLQYHTLQSTKYMAKWIEAKNERDRST